MKYISVSLKVADPGGRAVYGVGSNPSEVTDIRLLSLLCVLQVAASTTA